LVSPRIHQPDDEGRISSETVTGLLNSNRHMAQDDLKQSDVMKHLMDSLDEGKDIGHYGRLVFVMVARHFLDDDELVKWLAKDKDCDEKKARTLIAQVEARGYNPPKRERILAWMNEQTFPICQEPDNPDACNVYRSLDFPEDIYHKISSYYEAENRKQTA
jgi:DNA primase large subunit